MLRRLLPYGIGIFLTTLALLAIVQNTSWRALPQAVGLGEAYEAADERANSRKNIVAIDEDPNAWREGADTGQLKEPKVDSSSPYPVGKTKAPGSNYTKCLVVPKMSGEDTSWIKKELGDMLDSGLLTAAIYAMDDPSAPLHPVENKGNEVMAYLSYLIDSYDDLPDVAIFMHSHRYAWHNNLILNQDSSVMVRRLSPERVTREGYMNLRCHWEPGCPEWMHPGEIERIYEKQEEHILADSWAELFPQEQIPAVLAQPCCAQFAVSRDRIKSIPKQRFVWLRDWVLRTELSDFLSGRIFEYVWQYIFTASPLHCPSMSACYCDGYGVCFGDPEKFDYYFELNFNLNKYTLELKDWIEKAKEIASAKGLKVHEGGLNGEELLDVPEVGRDKVLKGEISKLEAELKRRRKAAIELGQDPAQRAKEAGRPWKKGDGF